MKRSFKFSCLILEDDPTLRNDLAAVVEMEGGSPTVCRSISEAKQCLGKDEFEILLFDNYLPDGKGEDLFLSLPEKGVYAPCVMLTGVPEIATAVRLTRNGLFDYLTKPLDLDKVRDVLQRALQNFREAESTIAYSGLVARSAAMKRVYRLACQAAASLNSTVLITGESGVGKDAVAKVIHSLTFRQVPESQRMQNFVHINCSALPAEILESELFGTKKGAFTGAAQDRVGLAEAAGNGTLFLDEIAELPLPMQSKLLHFLETGTFRKVGSTTLQTFKGRIIAATNKTLKDEVNAGRFRKDLLFRLDVFNIYISPLRERKEDIPELAIALLESLARKFAREKPLIAGYDLEVIQQHAFPGNVRELRNVLERSLIQTPIGSKWLTLDPEWRYSIISQPQALSIPIPGRELPPLDKAEYLLMRDALRVEGGHIRQTAARLKISHQALLRKLEKWPELRQAHQLPDEA